MSTKVVEIPAVWIAGASCSGCSVSLLNAVSPTVKNLLIDPIIPGKHLNLRFHSTVMAGQGEPAMQVLQATRKADKGGYLVLVEGSVVGQDDGLYCTIGEVGGKQIAFQDKLLDLARDALAVVVSVGCVLKLAAVSPFTKPA